MTFAGHLLQIIGFVLIISGVYVANSRFVGKLGGTP